MIYLFSECARKKRAHEILLEWHLNFCWSLVHLHRDFYKDDTVIFTGTTRGGVWQKMEQITFSWWRIWKLLCHTVKCTGAHRNFSCATSNYSNANSNFLWNIAEYRMDEQFQNCEILEPNFDFPNWKKSRNF